MAGANFGVNPLLWAHFRVQGGWRNALTLTVGYCLIAGVIAAFTFQGKLDIKPRAVATVWLVVLSLLQSGLLVLMGTGGVRRAIQQDFTTGMMDSHRLTPVSGPSAVFGYIVGPNVALLILVAANTLIGLPLCATSGYPAKEWLLGIVVVLVFAALLWSLSAVGAMATHGSANVALFLAIASVMGGWIVVAIVPGVGALIFGVVGATLGMLPGASATLSPNITFTSGTIAAQIVIAATFFWAAARKYRRPDQRAFPVWLGVALLAEFATVGGLGILVWAARPRSLLDVPSAEVPTQIVATLTALALVALLPISAMVHRRVTWERRHKLEPHRAGARPSTPLLGIVGMVLLIVILVGLPSESAMAGRTSSGQWRPVAERTHMQEWILSFAVLTAALIPPGLLLWPLYRRKASGAAFVGLWLVVVWLLPPLIDLMVNVAMSPQADANITWLTGCSPVGALALIWRLRDIALVPGLVVHVTLAIAMGMLVLRQQKLRAKESVTGNV
jgi:hypothetical protein